MSKAQKTNLGIHVGEEREELVEQTLPPAGRGAACPLGGVVVVGRGGRGGRGRYKLVAEDGGGPLAAHYRRHGGPRPDLRHAPPPPPIRSWPPIALLAPSGAGHHLARGGPAGAPLLTRRSTAGWGVGLGSEEARRRCPWPETWRRRRSGEMGEGE